MLCSLHLICNPAHHLRHIEWAERVRSEMEPSFLVQLEEHYEDFNGWCSAMEFCDHHADFNNMNILYAIDCLYDLDDAVFMHILTEQVTDIKHYESRDYNKLFESGVTAPQLEVFKNASAYKRKFIALLKKYYYKHFEDELGN